MPGWLLSKWKGLNLQGDRSVDFVLHFSKPHQAQLRVNTVHEKGTVRYTTTDSLEDTGGKFEKFHWLTLTHRLLGGNLNAASRQALMQKLARTEPALELPEMYVPTHSGPSRL